MRILSLAALALAGCAALLTPVEALAYQEQAICIHVDEAANTDDEYYAPWPFPGTWDVTQVYFSPSTAVAVDATDAVAATVAFNAGTASTTWTTVASHTTDTDGAEEAYVIGTSIDLTVTADTLLQGYSIRIENTNAGSGKAWNGTYCVVAVKR